jgi:hypothetical protein
LRASARNPAAALLANMAYMEAASVDAFERLASELEAYGAPVALRLRAIRAARDERRHARVMSALARRAGATVPTPRVTKVSRRSLETIARENAVEGCVNETFGAALAAVQAACARDERVRAAMRRIAADEKRHAELAWSVAEWIEARLDGAARERVRGARTRAARAIVRGKGRDVVPGAANALGLPTASQARSIALELMRSLGVIAAEPPKGHMRCVATWACSGSVGLSPCSPYSRSRPLPWRVAAAKQRPRARAPSDRRAVTPRLK